MELLSLSDHVHAGEATIRYGVTGSGKDIILVHGAAAHSKWWNPIIPLLEENWRVITLDLSGHGDSEHRESYSPQIWAGEIEAVLNRVGAHRPLFVGHSMGGRLGISCVAAQPETFAGLVLFDVPVRPPHLYRKPYFTPRNSRTYSTLEQALDRFHLLPKQTEPPPSVLAPIARHSVRRAEFGWTWKADPKALNRFDDQVVDREARAVRCPVVVVYGAQSTLVSQEVAAYAAHVMQAEETLRVENAAHHVILDQPGTCASIIDAAARRVLLPPSH